MIRDMRRGHVPSVQRLRSLCEVLDLEFFVGPPRMRRDDGRDLPDVPLRTLERAAQDLAQLTADAGGNPISDDLWSVLTARRAAEPPPAESESSPPDARSPDAAPPEAADGGGEEPPAAHHHAGVWMNNASLRMRGLDHANCKLVKIRDEYMEPTLPKGCMVLVDGTSTDWQPPRIMVVRINDDLIARRAALGDDGRRLLASDHPALPVAHLSASAEVVGEVRWVGLWLNRAPPARDQAEDAPVSTLSQDWGSQAG